MDPCSRVVAAVFIDDALDEPTVFAARRRAGESLAGFWELPCGKVHDDEDDATALTRALRETLDVNITVGDELATTQVDYEFDCIQQVTYRAEFLSGPPRLHVHDTFTWVPLSQLNTLNWAPQDLDALKAISKVAATLAP